MTSRWLVAGWLAVTAAAAGAQGAPAVDPERQLESIRHALVDATTSAPVRVQSYGWIDAEGRLHESTQFTSDTRVRGVRLPSYVEDPAPAVAARRPRVDAAGLPAGLGPRASTDGPDPDACLAQSRRWRQGLHVEVVTAPGLPAQGPLAGHRLATDVQRAFLAANQRSVRWVAQPRPYQPATAYEKALVWRDAQRTEWLARIELAASEEEGEASGVEARLEVGPAGQPALARRLRVPMPPAAGPVGVSQAALDAAMAQAVAALDRQGACDPLWYSVTFAGEAMRLREGSAHGLQPGDRLLLVERRYLPDRLLEPGAVRALALVQVGRPSDNGTDLQWLAGPRPAQPGDWVALPL